MSQWFLGSQNDGLFIINQPPRPSNDDQVHEHRVGISPDLAISLGSLPHKQAQAIVDAHNATVGVLLKALTAIRDINLADPEEYVRKADETACEALAKVNAVGSSEPVVGNSILDHLEHAALGQLAYFSNKQRTLPAIEDFTDKDGVFQAPADIEPLLEARQVNGRYTEANWWLTKIREIKDVGHGD